MVEPERRLLVPDVTTIVDIRDETDAGDVKTFRVELDDPARRAAWRHLPGQCAMVSVFGVGEAMISITSSPTRGWPLELSVKRVGRVTGALHDAQVGDKIGLRGPYGNHFPTEDWTGKDLVFIAGGIGLAPVRCLIDYCLAHRDRFGHVHIIYGARSPGDLCFKSDLFERWPKEKDTRVSLTVDKGDENWKGPVGFVPAFVEELKPSPENSVTITCGPPIMIKLVLQSLAKLGYRDDQIVTTLELKMQCGVGKCGRCNIGDKYVCVDGPVFTLSQIKQLPNEF
ncbi:MAG: FAD/NAD(P)-binding protein [Firmicutes bacterium]|nr:FAD/NAD(P)-binding protein [Bacillota bacterium]